ncbi:hypothetical protein [Baekduia sp. Peel2402]|uniref:hypothetical protein n=1 Tax=Baekduia sp. Peel2402 TaxID=3458296 RepID=UPI00403E80CA
MPQPKKPAPPAPDELVASLGVLRERLVSSITLTSDRLQEAVDDAVRRGRMTRKDAEELLSTLLTAGRAQTEALLAEVEGLVRRRPGSGGGASAFPIEDYNSLTAAQVNAKLGDLSAAELRKVRAAERKGKNRKSVLAAVERKLG